MHEDVKPVEANEATTPAPVPEVAVEPKPKRQRRPRKPKVEAAPEPAPAPVAAAPAPKKPRKAPQPAAVEEPPERPFKMPKHYVEHSNTTVTLMGNDVKLRVMTPATRAAHGIKEVVGVMGKPCDAPLIIKFKSRASALKFFDLCLHADNEKDEYIDCGSKTDWFSEELMRGFS